MSIAETPWVNYCEFTTRPDSKQGDNPVHGIGLSCRQKNRTPHPHGTEGRIELTLWHVVEIRCSGLTLISFTSDVLMSKSFARRAGNRFSYYWCRKAFLQRR